MQIEMQALSFSLTKAIRDHIEQRVNSAMSSLDENINRVVVTLSNVTGHRIGIDKRCHIQVKLHALEDVVIEDIEWNLYFAINRAVDRARRKVSRKLAQQSNHTSTLTLPARRLLPRAVHTDAA